MRDAKIGLSYKAAKRCEEAQGPDCDCRCGGKYHGAKRGAIKALPLSDPHYIEPERRPASERPVCEMCKRPSRSELRPSLRDPGMRVCVSCIRAEIAA